MYSASDRLFGSVPVGMMAKWSEILALLKMRLFGFTQPCLVISLANGAYWSGRVRMTSLTVPR